MLKYKDHSQTVNVQHFILGAIATTPKVRNHWGAMVRPTGKTASPLNVLSLEVFFICTSFEDCCVLKKSMGLRECGIEIVSGDFQIMIIFTSYVS